MSAKTVEFYDVKTRDKIQVPAANCTLNKIETAKGERWQVTTVLKADGKERKLSRFVSKDFKLG